MMGLEKLLPDRPRKWLPLCAVLGLMLIPAVAAAIPGSGAFISQNSHGGSEITQLYNLIGKICLGILIFVEGILFYAIFKFRRQSDDERPEQVHGNLKLEIGWTLAAAAIQLFIGFKTIDVMFQVETAPQDGTELVVEAIAQQWSWSFRYPEQQFRGKKIGGFTHEDLIVPANTEVELDVTSDDVLHAIWIPELGVKIDAVPGRYNYWWFSAEGPTPSSKVDLPKRQNPEEPKRATTRGEGFGLMSFVSGYNSTTYDQDATPEKVDYLAGRKTPEKSPYAKYNAREYVGMCAELCGSGHWNMYFRTVAMTKTSFFQWVEDKKAASQSADVNGAELFAKNCKQCHGADGTGAGSSFPPLKGSKWTNNEDMKQDHIEVVLMGSNAESLKGPTTVKGSTFNGAQMASHKTLNNAEVAAVVNHERTSWGNSGGKVTRKDVAKVREKLGLEDRPVVQAGGVEPAKLRERGKQLFESCTGCHGADGKGAKSVPNLAGNSKVVGSPEPLIDTLVNGQDTGEWKGAQTPVGRGMTDRDLAALVTYMRQSWGNETSPVQPPEIRRIRKKLKK
ncbi:MAG: c-type cytochrome [Bradymonadaceae bacterium]